MGRWMAGTPVWIGRSRWHQRPQSHTNCIFWLGFSCGRLNAAELVSLLLSPCCIDNLLVASCRTCSQAWRVQLNRITWWLTIKSYWAIVTLECWQLQDGYSSKLKASFGMQWRVSRPIVFRLWVTHLEVAQLLFWLQGEQLGYTQRCLNKLNYVIPSQCKNQNNDQFAYSSVVLCVYGARVINSQIWDVSSCLCYCWQQLIQVWHAFVVPFLCCAFFPSDKEKVNQCSCTLLHLRKVIERVPDFNWACLDLNIKMAGFAGWERWVAYLQKLHVWPLHARRAWPRSLPCHVLPIQQLSSMGMTWYRLFLQVLFWLGPCTLPSIKCLLSDGYKLPLLYYLPWHISCTHAEPVNRWFSIPYAQYSVPSLKRKKMLTNWY